MKFHFRRFSPLFLFGVKHRKCRNGEICATLAAAPMVRSFHFVPSSRIFFSLQFTG
jgi:hypothetical protein